jgi:ABC-type nitrate/sulfonate/bicarbonate transport system substrate-binding protein
LKRRQFLQSTAAVAGAATLGSATTVNAQGFPQPEVIRIGHLVGICMSPLFYGHATGMFKAEGLNVELRFVPNPGDGLAALVSGAIQIAHVPFTNVIVAAHNGAPVRTIAGSGAGGIFLIAQGSSGIKSMADLVKAKGKGVKIGAMRLNTFEMMAFRALANNGLKYDDFNMVWFNDTLSMAAAFEAKAVDVVTHVEPFSTNLVDKMGGVPIASNLETWGKDGPDCVTNARMDFIEKYPEAARRYLRVLLRADRLIRGDMAKAVDILDKGKYYRVDRETLRASLPRQLPQVDLTQGGDKGMEVAIKDMLALGYIKKIPEVMDLRLLRETLKTV